jgi:hypothetical protein
MGVHAYNPSYSGGTDRKIVIQAALGINTRPYLKNKVKRAGVVA